jgi:hypothetical protein
MYAGVASSEICFYAASETLSEKWYFAATVSGFYATGYHHIILVIPEQEIRHHYHNIAAQPDLQYSCTEPKLTNSTTSSLLQNELWQLRL